MKLYKYIILFVLLIIYIKCQSTNTYENFTDNLEVNQYDVLKTNIIKPIFIDDNSNKIRGYDLDELDVYNDKYWTIKNTGFSDIYNYEDIGGDIIYNVANELDIDIKKVPEQPSTNNVYTHKLFVEIKYGDYVYKLLGSANNSYFNQHYYIYENEINQKIPNPLLEEELDFIKNNKVYQYLLVKMNKEKLDIKHWIGPRNKVNIGDIVYFSLATYQLGPLSITKLK